MEIKTVDQHGQENTSEIKAYIKRNLFCSPYECSGAVETVQAELEYLRDSYARLLEHLGKHMTPEQFVQIVKGWDGDYKKVRYKE